MRLGTGEYGEDVYVPFHQLLPMVSTDFIVPVSNVEKRIVYGEVII